MRSTGTVIGGRGYIHPCSAPHPSGRHGPLRIRNHLAWLSWCPPRAQALYKMTQPSQKNPTTIQFLSLAMSFCTITLTVFSGRNLTIAMVPYEFGIRGVCGVRGDGRGPGWCPASRAVLKNPDLFLMVQDSPEGQPPGPTKPDATALETLPFLRAQCRGGTRPRVSVRREVGPACADVWRGGGSTCADVWRTGWSACADIWQMCNAVFFFPLCIFEHLTGERRITAPGPHTQLFGGARH